MSARSPLDFRRLLSRHWMAVALALGLVPAVVVGFVMGERRFSDERAAMTKRIEDYRRFLTDASAKSKARAELDAKVQGLVDLMLGGMDGFGFIREVRRRTDDAWVFRPLGTHANKHGRALGDSLAGGTLAFDGMTDTSITRFAGGGQYLEVARTGLRKLRESTAKVRTT